VTDVDIRALSVAMLAEKMKAPQCVRKCPGHNDMCYHSTHRHTTETYCVVTTIALQSLTQGNGTTRAQLTLGDPEHFQTPTVTITIVNDDQQDATILAYLFIRSQLYVFRAMSSPIIRST
jgi:hypothetical protein